MVRRDRKALIRIIEAVIAVLLITSAFLIILSKQQSFSEDEVHDRQRAILEFIIKDNDLREKAFNSDMDATSRDELKAFISQVAPKSWKYSFNVCEINLVCPNLESVNPEIEIFSSETIITSPITSDIFETKRLRFFVWIG